MRITTCFLLIIGLGLYEHCSPWMMRSVIRSVPFRGIYNTNSATISSSKSLGGLVPVAEAHKLGNPFKNMLASIKRNTRLMSTAAVEASSAPVEIFRKDYLTPANFVTEVSMDFDIEEGKTVVKSDLVVRKNADSKNDKGDLLLDGDSSSVTLLSACLDGGEPLVEGVDYELGDQSMVIFEKALPKSDTFTLSTEVSIVPEDNTQLSGFYKSGPMYCSQCEAEGFRRITYYPDRPDNMATFKSVRITADKAKYPVLLSNGNLVKPTEDVGGGKHSATWSDPFPKPSYLFAIVVGDLGSISDSFTTSSGRKVHLEIFSEKENVDKLDYAMESLKNSMKWDEDKVRNGRIGKQDKRLISLHFTLHFTSLRRLTSHSLTTPPLPPTPVRTRVRPRHLQRCGCERLQHGRHGEQRP